MQFTSERNMDMHITNDGNFILACSATSNKVSIIEI